MQRKTYQLIIIMLIMGNVHLFSQNLLPMVMTGNDTAITADSIMLTGQSNDPDGSIDSVKWNQILSKDLRYLQGVFYYNGGLAYTLYEINWQDGGLEVIPNLTSNQDQGYTVTANVNESNAWKVYDGDGGTGWTSNSAENIITLDVGDNPGVLPDEVDFQLKKAQGRSPDSVVLQGSYDGDSWHVLAAEGFPDNVSSHTQALDTNIPASVPQVTMTGDTTDSLSVSGFIAGYTYLFEYKAWDNSGAVSSDTIAITVHEPPVVYLGDDTTTTNDSIILTGMGSDPDGSSISYQWTKLSPQSVNLNGDTTEQLTVSGLTSGEIYQFELMVTDSLGGMARDTIQVTVHEPPVAMVGNDTTINGDSIQLIGEGTDPDGTIESFKWTQITMESIVMEGDLTDTLSISGLTVGTTYQFKLEVTDNYGATGSDTISVYVNIPPTSMAGNDTIIETDSITINGSGLDADGTITNYQWSQLSGPAATLSGEDTEVLRINDLMRDSVYLFKLEVTDNNGAVSGDTIKLTVDIIDNVMQINVESIKIYPNPLGGGDVLSIDLQGVDGVKAVSVLNMQGQEVYQVSDIDRNLLKINSSIFAPGTYILKISGQNQDTIVKPFVVK
ncbi:MAG: PKD domain-containing protein [Bacteroidota bacterium]